MDANDVMPAFVIGHQVFENLRVKSPVTPLDATHGSVFVNRRFRLAFGPFEINDHGTFLMQMTVRTE